MDVAAARIPPEPTPDIMAPWADENANPDEARRRAELERERARLLAELQRQTEDVERLRAERAALERSVRAKEAAAARRRDGH